MTGIGKDQTLYSIYQTLANASPEVRIALKVLRDRHRTQIKAANKKVGQAEAEKEKLERTIRDQQLELGRLKFRIAELESTNAKATMKAERTAQQNTSNSRRPRGIGRHNVPYIPDGRKYP